MRALRQSVERHGKHLHTYPERPSGCVENIRQAIRFLKSRDERYVMFLDSSTSLMCLGEEVLMNRYRRLGRPVVLSAQSTCCPDSMLFSRYPEVDKRCRSTVDSGAWMGRRENALDLLAFLGDYASTLRLADIQLVWTRAYLQGKLHEVELDRTRLLFGCQGEDGGVISRTEPVIRRWPGNTTGREDYWKNDCMGLTTKYI